MLVVPRQGDKIKLLSSPDSIRVSSYTSLKSEPAVYLSAPLEDGSKAVYFSDIVELNGVAVEYDSDSKLLKAMGPIKRKYNLPQPRDTIVIKLIDTDFKQEATKLTVAKLKLHSRNDHTKALLICSEKTCVPITDIVDIEREVGYEKFNSKDFIKYYEDYLPLNPRAK